MKMKTERGRRKVGRRLGLPEATPKATIRRVSLHRPVERNAIQRQAEVLEEALEKETTRPPDEQS